MFINNFLFDTLENVFPITVDILNLAVFLHFTWSIDTALSHYGRYWITHNIACEKLPKGSVANDSVAAWRWCISDTRLFWIPQCLQRSLAVRMHTLLGCVRQRTRIRSLICHLKKITNAIRLEIAFWSCGLDAIIERGYWRTVLSFYLQACMVLLQLLIIQIEML